MKVEIKFRNGDRKELTGVVAFAKGAFFVVEKIPEDGMGWCDSTWYPESLIAWVKTSESE